MKKQKDTPFLRSILKDSFNLSWQYKKMWLVGFVAFFVLGTFGYQLVIQGVQSIVQPTQWWERWEAFSNGISVTDILSGQFQILLNDPYGWLAAVSVWALFLLVLLVIYFISIYALTILVVFAKGKINKKEKISFSLLLQEAKFSVWNVFGLMLLFHLVSNVLIIAFSIPVVWFGVTNQGVASTIFLAIFFGLFLVLAFMLAMIFLYALLSAIVEEKKISDAIISAWSVFKKHWVITLEMFLIQVLVLISSTVIVVLFTSLLIVPVAIIGFLLVSNQIFAVTSFLPQLLLLVLSVALMFVSIFVNMFQLYTWTNLFIRFEEVHPKSRLAAWIEVNLLTS